MNNTSEPNDANGKSTANPSYLRDFLKVWLLFVSVAVLRYVLSFPKIASINFIFGDEGANLKADFLIAQGYSPTIDFDYLYGLLPLVIGRGWFALFGRTPWAYLAAMLIFNILIVTALTKIALAAQLRPLGIIFIAVAIPFSVQPSYPNFTHALEALLICVALGEHIAGRRGNALLFVAVCFFVKPSMSFVYAFLIINLYGLEFLRKRTSLSSVYREILPAALTTIFLTTAMVISFGIMPTVNSLFPIEAAKHYKAVKYGFFNEVGSNFWHPPGVKFSYYLGTPAGFWLLSTILLVSYTGYLYSTSREPNKSKHIEVQSCILILHISFVVLFFGAAWSWSYYSYLITIGISLIATRESEIIVLHLRKQKKYYEKIFLFVLIVLLIIGNKTEATALYTNWKLRRPSDITMGLWSELGYRQEFIKVVNSCRVSNVIIFSLTGGSADLFFPHCSMPEAWYILPGLDNSKQTARVSKQLFEAEVLVIPAVYSKPESLFNLKEYKRIFQKFKVYQKGTYFWFAKRQD